MALPSRGVRKTTETVVNNNSSIQVVPYNNKKKIVIDRDRLHHYHHNHQTITSPERRMVWIEPKSKPKMEIVRKVPVVYYLSKDGHLEHPHFIEVPLSSNDGLYLNDVINRLNSLRGKGMASMYSWSSKRSYKNGFVWHDLCENDFIYPAHGQEYVLKGSEFLETFSSFRSQNQDVIIPEKLAQTQHYHHKSVGESNNEFPVVVVQTQRSRNQSWSSIDGNHNHIHEYKVYKTESSSTGEYSGKAADAATQTQTDHEKRRITRRLIREEEDDEQNHEEENQTTELSREEISPPPSSSSPETLESMIKADVRIKSNIISEPSSSSLLSSDIRNLTGNNHPSGRVKASAVLKQLISCGSFTVKDGGGPEEESSNQGFSFIQHYRARLPHESSYHGAGNDSENPSCFSAIGLEEDKEYFSGSLVEMNKDDYAATSFTRSPSYNADRSSKLEIEKETRGVGEDEYIPKRKPKTSTTKKDTSDNMNKISRTPLHGSKRQSHDPIR